MKKLVIILLLVSFVFAGKSQIAQLYSNQYGQDNWYTYNNLYGVSGWGVASFYWGITKSQFTDVNNKYRYKIWVISNSYVWNYSYGVSEWRYTYIWNIKVNMSNRVVSFSNDGFSFKDLYCIERLTFYSTNSSPYFYFYTNYKML